MYIFIVEEAVDALYMTILQEMDRFSMLIYQIRTCLSGENEERNNDICSENEEASIAPAGGILDTRWKGTVSLKHSSSAHATHAAHATHPSTRRSLLLWCLNDSDLSRAE